MYEVRRLTFLELFQALESDLELIRVSELCRVVEDIDAEERNHRHLVDRLTVRLV